MKKKIVSLIFVCIVALMLPVMAFAAPEVVKKGYCGIDIDNLSWVLTDDGVLTISGSGGMFNFTRPIPSWTSLKDDMVTVVIEDGVTSIGEAAFKNCSSLTDVTIPDSVTEIGDLAFCGCESLVKINIPEGLKKIGDQAFYHCNSLTEIRLPESLEEMGESCFCGCSL